jgi:hypothetical protein
MNPDQDTTRRDLNATGLRMTAPFNATVNTMLRCEDGIEGRIAQDAADSASLAIHKDPTRFSDIERGRAIAGITKLALGTYEEAIALENTARVSGLSHSLGAVVYALSATHGPADNLYLLSEGLYKIDRELAASVLGEIVRHDPSQHVRELALQWLAYSLPSDAAKLVGELSRDGAFTPEMEERYQRAVASQATEAPGERTILSTDEQQTVMRIFPAIQHITTGTTSAYRVSAVEVLAEEHPLYAIPMLTLAAQVSEPQVRDAALTALARIDPETASIVRDTTPSFVSRLDTTSHLS